MGLSILSGIGSKLGLDLVSNIMDKTLPKAFDFMKTAMNAPIDAFESVVNTFGGKASKTKPSKQFMIAFPKRLSAWDGTRFADKMKSMSGKLNGFKDVLGSLSDVMNVVSKCLPGKPHPGKVMAQGSTGYGKGLNTDTQAMAQASGYGNEVMPGEEMDPMAMFQKMQEAQMAAQMFEMAVKISEIQHQASMSAIRGIRY